MTSILLSNVCEQQRACMCPRRIFRQFVVVNFANRRTDRRTNESPAHARRSPQRIRAIPSRPYIRAERVDSAQIGNQRQLRVSLFLRRRRRNDATTQRRSDAATQRRNDAATQRRSDAATQRRSDPRGDVARRGAGCGRRCAATAAFITRIHRIAHGNDVSDADCVPEQNEQKRRDRP